MAAGEIMRDVDRLTLFIAAAEMTVLRAMGLAGSSRGALREFKPFSVHGQRPVQRAQLNEILPGAA
jgi:hypothetical protein